MPQLDFDQKLKVSKTILLNDPYQHGVEAKRQEILLYFQQTYDIYEKLFATLTEKAFYMRADPLRHPLIFYLGHTASFIVNKYLLAGLMTERINPEYESLFAVGVDEMSWDDLLEDKDDWPAVSKVFEYRDKVRAAAIESISKASFTLPITQQSPMWIVLMGIEHERIHLETSTVLIRQLPLEVLQVDPFWNICGQSRASSPKNDLLPVLEKAVTVKLGKDLRHNLYGWDNEYGKASVEVAPFSASQFLVSNAEYYEFVADGGYQTQSYWTEEGWRWCTFRAKKPYPLFWVWTGEQGANFNTTQWRFRCMLEEIEMPWDWPVEVNNLEAKAFCNWKSSKKGILIRLPTEAEYQHLRAQEVPEDQPFWKKAPGNINLEYYCSSTPVDLFGPSPSGFYDVIGNVWQHTETPIEPFENFAPHPYYDDFSLPTFDTQHNLLMGGSWVSTGNEATFHARYAFRRHFMQNAGIRYVYSRDSEIFSSNSSSKSSSPSSSSSSSCSTSMITPKSFNIYELDDLVSQYAVFHYHPETYFGVPNFPAAVAQICIQEMERLNIKMGRALDIGCAVGRTTFELAKSFEYALGLDFSTRFIRFAIELQEKEQLLYETKEEGEICTQHSTSLTQLGLRETSKRAAFYQGDACNLDTRWKNFDLVVAANLVCRLYSPASFLSTIHTKLNVNGLLVLLTPCTWMEEHTPKSNWIGGYIDQVTGKPVTTFEGLRNILLPNFRLVRGPEEIPFCIRETARKFQHSTSQLSVWQKLPSKL